MALIGAYRDRVTVLTRVLAAADATGEEVESWPDPAPGTGGHWGRVEQPAAGEVLAPVRQSYGGMTLRFRHLVTLAAVDKVRFAETGEEYGVTGIRRERAECGGWQTVCTLVG